MRAADGPEAQDALATPERPTPGRARSVARTRKPRVRIGTAAPKQLAAMYELARAIDLDERLGELIKVHVSQLNRCAFCVDMHWRDARGLGEPENRLYALAAWRDSDVYDRRERAALALAEALTLLDEREIDSDLWDDVAARFDETQLAQLLFLIATINAWNRLMIGAGIPAPK